MSNWKYKIHKRKAACPLITFANNPSRLFEGNMQKPNNLYKDTTVMHHHIVCYIDHGNVPEYACVNLQR